MARGGRGRVVVITGASAGVGRATARRFAREGAHIGLIARGREGLEAAQREVEELGGQGLVLQADVGDAAALEDAALRVEEAFGPIDVWVNNAMVSVYSPVRELQAEEVARVTQVTYLGSVYGTLCALRRMLPRDRGTIVLVGSALAHRGIPLQAAYCGAKHAMKGFFESLRSELMAARSRVHVTMVHMPALNTPHFRMVKSRLARKPQPVPPIFQPELAADAIHWAAGARRREVLVGFPTVKVVLGNRVAPWFLDRYLARTGFESQQTDTPEDPGRPHNLWEPVPGDQGARGVFTARSKRHSVQLWVTRHRAAVALVALGLAARLLRR